MPITINHGFPIPAETQANDVPADLGALAIAIDQEMSLQGPLESRPAYGHQGRFYFALTRVDASTGNSVPWNVMYRDTGYSWNQVSDAAPVPVGAMFDYPGGTIPLGYVLGDGTIYAFTKYPALGAAYGNRYGGDGVNTFGVPNTIEKFTRGSTVANRGEQAGQDEVMQTIDMLAEHHHTVIDDINGSTYEYVLSSTLPSETHYIPENGHGDAGGHPTSVTYSHLDLSTADAGSNEPIPTLPVYVGIPKIIKAF